MTMHAPNIAQNWFKNQFLLWFGARESISYSPAQQESDYARDRAINQIFNLIGFLGFTAMILIHTSAPVTLLLKLSGGQSPSWIGGFWYLSALVSFIMFITAPKRTFEAVFYAWPFILISFLALSSYAWSIEPPNTLKGAIFMSLSQLGAVSMAARYSWDYIIRYFAIILTTLVGISVLLAIGVPRIGQMQEIYPGAWSGIWAEKQALGFFAVLQIIFASLLGLKDKKHRIWLLAPILGLVAILGTQGKTALIMVFVGGAAVVGTRLLQQGKRLMLVVLWLGIVCTAIGAAVYFAAPDLIFELTGKSKDLTGRIEIWQGIDYLVAQRPTWGHGYATVWDNQTDLVGPYQWIEIMADFKPQNAHSSYRDVLLSMGKVGLYLLVFSLIKTIIDAISVIRTDKDGSAVTLAIILSLLTISATETVFLGNNNLLWFLIVMCGTKIALEKHKYYKELRAPKRFSKTKPVQIEPEVFTY